MLSILILLAAFASALLVGVTFTQNSVQLLQYPQRMVQGDLSNATFPIAGIALTPALFGLQSITDIICGPVQIAGSVNTLSVIAKWDPVTATLFAFQTGTAVSTSLGIITGAVAAVVTIPVTIFGTPIPGS